MKQFMWFILSLLFLYRLVSETVPIKGLTRPMLAIRPVSLKTRQAHIRGMCR
nr:MAG TPA: hypothetical protein [Caudoviricetes sp.]